MEAAAGGDAGAGGGGGTALAAGAPGTTAPAAAAAPAPYYSDFFGKDGAINHSAFERMPEPLRGLTPTLQNIKTADDFMGKFAHLNTLAGRKGLAPLPADAKPEDVAAQQAILRAVNGVPEKPEGYGFQRPEDLPETAWDAENAKAAAAIMHKHNISPAAAKELVELQTSLVKGNLAAQQKYEQDFFAQQENDFRAALQKDGQDYDKTMVLVGQVAQRFGMPADAPMLKNAQVRLMLAQVGKAIGESAVVTGQGTGGDTRSDRAQADDITHNKSNPDYAAYWDANHPKNAEVKARVVALYEKAHTSENASRTGR